MDLRKNLVKVIMGGPMMGMAQRTLDVPIIKELQVFLQEVKRMCERWSRTSLYPMRLKGVDACPMGLVPSIECTGRARRHYVVAKEEYDLMIVLNAVLAYMYALQTQYCSLC